MLGEEGLMWFDFKLYKTSTIDLTPHELAHWFHGQFMLQNSIDWTLNDTLSPRNRGAWLVAEGIAIYLSSLVGSGESEVGSEDYEDPYTSLFQGDQFNKWIYIAAEKFTRPVLDKNFILAVTYLSKNLPEPESAVDLITYQQDLLKKLE